jgi:nucleoside-diphosphate-sugar epimerase
MYRDGRNYLVTGGAGFVGAHLTRRLLDLGHRVTVFDIASPAEPTTLNVLGLSNAVEYVTGDVRRQEDLHALSGRGFAAAFHLAAQPISTLSNRFPQETRAVNIDGTRNVCAELGSETRIVFASSACSYGVPLPGASPLREETPLRQGFYVYTETKQRAEDIVVNSASDAVIGRFVNIYGPGDRHFSRIIPRTIRQLSEGCEAALSRGNGSSVLDFLFITDAVDGFMRMADLDMDLDLDGRGSRAGSERPVFNFGVGDGHALPVRDLVRMIGSCFDGRERDPALPAAPAEPEMVKYLDPSKAMRRLGWKPKIRLPEGLRITLEWYRANIHAMAPLEDEDLDAIANRRAA